MPSAKIRKGDEIIVIAGNDKGTRGKVEKVFSSRSELLITGVNIKKKTVRAQPDSGETGGIRDVNRPVHCSNVKIYNPDIQKGDRVFFKADEKGKKIRHYRSNGKPIV